MISLQELYAATNDGLDIITLHHPEAYDAAQGKTKHFKLRSGERTPSASIKKYPAKDGAYNVWKVTDFGGDGRAIDPIQIHMDATGRAFAEAILDLAERFGVSSTLNSSVNRPLWDEVPATAEQEEGQTYWDLNDGFTSDELKIWGPHVSEESLRALHWHSVRRIGKVKNRVVKYRNSTPNYPIFMRECWYTDAAGNRDRFFKVYEPLNPEKQYRFTYQPAGKKPQKYVNGLEELQTAYRALNDRLEREWCTDPANDGKPYRPTKIPEAVICSGERDAACVHAYGSFPIWFNSETYKVEPKEYKSFADLVDTVYNIPDLDDTGVRKGRELAMQYIDVHTVWLPEWLSTYKDHRGKPRKDLRDFVDLRPAKSAFTSLLRLANPVKFWVEEQDKKGKVKTQIDPEALIDFLHLNGFYTMRDYPGADPKLVKVDDYAVKVISGKEVRAFAIDWSRENALPRPVRKLLLTSTYLSSAYLLDTLRCKEFDFHGFTANSQWYYHPNCCVEITAEGIKKYDKKSSPGGKYVLDDKIIKHQFTELAPMFDFELPDDATSVADIKFTVNPHASKFFGYLINSSRLYWRDELELGWGDTPADEIRRYCEAHKFDIAGPRLSEEARKAQLVCLLTRMFTVGYLLHRYKSPSRPWAPYVMDNVIGANDQCNGGSGKSFFFLAISELIKMVKISGKTPSKLESRFVFSRVTKHTDFIFFDDLHKHFDVKDYLDSITTSMETENKGTDVVSIAYADSPKFCFSTNYVPRTLDAAVTRRSLFTVVSDYYHDRTKGSDYLQARTIADDFGGRNLMGDSYTEAEWNADINFMYQCLSFYLSVVGRLGKIAPDLSNIEYRRHRLEMSDSFIDWATVYLAPESGHLDCYIVREDMFNDYRYQTNQTRTSSQKFRAMLEAFCATTPHISGLNPRWVCNSGTRIIRRVAAPGSMVAMPKEMFYVESLERANRLAVTTPPGPELGL